MVSGGGGEQRGEGARDAQRAEHVAAQRALPAGRAAEPAAARCVYHCPNAWNIEININRKYTVKGYYPSKMSLLPPHRECKVT